MVQRVKCPRIIRLRTDPSLYVALETREGIRLVSGITVDITTGMLVQDIAGLYILHMQHYAERSRARRVWIEREELS